MDKKYFDSLYDEWRNTLCQIIREKFIGSNEISFAEKVITLFSQDAVKYDILILLKSNEFLYYEPKDRIRMTETTLKEEYGIQDSSAITSFKNGKKRAHQYFRDILFETPMPIFFFNVYSTKPQKKSNPFCREVKDTDLLDFFELRNTLTNSAKMVTEKMHNEQMRVCQDIITQYYLEMSYGFEQKKIITNLLCELGFRNKLYDPNYINTLKGKILYDILIKQKINYNIPTANKPAKIKDFRSEITYFTSSEFDLLINSIEDKNSQIVDTLCEISDYGHRKPNYGYTLFWIIYAKSLCLQILSDTERSLENVKEISDEQINLSLHCTQQLTQSTLHLLDYLLNNFTFSKPKDTNLTIDEVFLLSQISDLNAEIQNYLNSMSYNSVTQRKECTNMIPVSVMSYDFTYMTALQYMPLETTVLDMFLKHCSLSFERKEVYKKHYGKKLIDDCNGVLCSDESIKRLGNIYFPQKYPDTRLRTFKNILISIANSCFNTPTICTQENETQSREHALISLDTQDNRIDETLNNYCSIICELNKQKGIFCLLSLRLNLLSDILTNDSSYRQIMMINEIFVNSFIDLQRSLFTNGFSSSEEYRDYIASVYNDEALNHVRNILNANTVVDIGCLNSQTQNKIAEL